ncbi:MAG TPA: N-acetylmuramoyl-L-alanine amidase [Mesorhizobium sp.]|jgi:N-acetylmuramoyl-L-alanine amidase|nr:N-acetylmuramoyl-L-alanine amidase [Mesorhizobium sp.]
MAQGGRKGMVRFWSPMNSIRLEGLRALAATLLALAALAGSAASASADATARNFRAAGNAERVRVVLDFDREPAARWLLLRAPHRLVIDLPAVRLALDPAAFKPAGLLTGLRYGAHGDGARLMLSADGPFVVERFEVVKNESGEGFRLSADLTAASERQFDEALALGAQTTGSTGEATRRPRPEPREPTDRFRVVIDAGHGGDDTGAKGVSGIDEKQVTLDFAKALRDELAADGRYEVFLTREADVFMALDERVAIARRHEANLFVSLHADTVRQADVHGATVYTLSDQASDPQAEALAIRENLSDELAGLAVKQENSQVADILVDLIRRETHAFSLRFAETLLDEFRGGKMSLIKNPHRHAGFRVLRAPDVPSVLVELGYLSNKADDARLRDPKWRKKAMGAIAAAVGSFAGTASLVGG